MNIKKIVKFSFLIIVLLVVIIFFTNSLVLYQIKENNLSKKNVSELITIQERMSDLIDDLLIAKNENELENISKKILEYEKKFEIKYDEFFTYQKDDLIDYLIQDIHKKPIIKKDLETIAKNEKIIETFFEDIFHTQFEIIKYSNLFTEKYPQENQQRKELEKVILKTKNVLLIKEFGDMKYYSKEVLFQRKSQEYLDIWINEIDILAKNLAKKRFQEYKNIVKEVGSYAIKINELQIKETKLQKDINTILKTNRLINKEIEKNIDVISEEFINNVYFLIIFLLLFTILFIMVLSYKVNKNVGLSVNEIERQVKKGLRKINRLNKEIEDTQKEVIFTMGAIGESRSKETGNHVKRVAEYTKLFALYYGLDEKEAEMLKMASPMHDIGKVAIPDAILNKPGKFDEAEREIMNTHAMIGYEMLKHSKRPLLKMAATISKEHHEKWDGSGYPKGKKGENIHIYGRITALADVFDALGSDRCYKKAWDDERIFNLFREERGKHFEPKLVDIFFDNLDEFQKIRDRFKDN